MVQNDIHRLHVSLSGEGKTKDVGWFLRSLLAFVKGCGRMLFFACSGNGNGTSWNNRGGNGNYWSSSFNSARNARNLNFNSGGVNPQNTNNRYNGFAVRPVQLTILTILFSLIYGTDTAAAAPGSVSGILRCKTSQVETQLCQGMGEESQKEHGRAVRRFVLPSLQAPAVEMLHCGLSEEAGDIRRDVPRQDSASPVLQLHALPVREDVHTGLVQLHQGKRHALWYSASDRLLQEGEPQLAEKMLCDALGHTWLLHAHQPQEALGDCYEQSEEDGYACCQQRVRQDMGRIAGHGLCHLADGDYRHARPEGELCYCRFERRLDRARPCQVDAESAGWTWFADRQPDESAFQQCVPERVRPVHEAGTEVQVLWQVCGRCSCSVSKQGMAAVAGSSHQGFPESRAWAGASHGQAGDFGGASWCGVPWCLYQAVQDVYIKPCPAQNGKEDSGVRLFKTLEGDTLSQLLSWHLPAYGILQARAPTADEERDTAHRGIQRGYDQVYRQETIL